jgi:hypothetical protein
MSARKLFRTILGLCWLAPMATGPATAADLGGYAKSAISEAFFAERRQPGVSIAFVGATPAGDRLALSFSITPFVWVTNRPNRITDVAQADLVVVHLRSFKQLGATTDLDPRIAPIVQKNSQALERGGACTKITETHSGGLKRGFLFLSLEDNEVLRKSCLYGHVRALFGLREDGEIGEFADTFLADLTIARCISQMALPQPHPAPGEAKTAIVQALASGTCERGRR